MASRYVLYTVRRDLPREWDEQMVKLMKQRDQPCCDDDSDEEDDDEVEVGAEDDYLVMMMMKSNRL